MVGSMHETEMDVAREIRNGTLPSPHRFGNMWLLDLRITGTGESYRPQLNEYVYRKPEAYLNEDFVARCAGLPVVFEHPDTQALDSDSFHDRVIGTVILPYLKGSEVWGVARIYDDDAMTLLRHGYASTSPAVVYRNGDDLTTFEDGGIHASIEGRPSLIDHVAICRTGVWDKGAAPSGISV